MDFRSTVPIVPDKFRKKERKDFELYVSQTFSESVDRPWADGSIGNARQRKRFDKR